MDKIKCEVIRDLMPLVADEVASAESKEIVEGHMEGCEVCRAYYAGMTAQLARMAVPEDGPTSTFVKFTHQMEKRVRMKKVFIALTAAIVALCVVLVGVGVVYDRMNTSVPMPIEKTNVWLWCERSGEVNLAIRMKDGHGWYHNVAIHRESDIMYLTPYEPELKLWNEGTHGGLSKEFQLDLLWEDGQLYYQYMVGDTEYDVDNDRFDYVEEEFKIPIRFVRWGNHDNYTTIYEQGDEILTREAVYDLVYLSEKKTEAAATPAAIATPVPSVEAGD